MFGCIGGLFRFVFMVALLAVLGGGAYYYLKLHPEKAPWKGGVAAVQQKVETAKLSTEVKAALSLRESLKGSDIDVSGEKDVITLRGKVPTAEAVKTAETIAASVPGVRQVVNFLQVDTGAVAASDADGRSIGEKVDDEALELKVRAAFKLDRELVDAGFSVTSMRKALVLTSATATSAQKKRALVVARSVEGVAKAEVR
jgi:osmotically-inducible protein OsmY